MGVELKECDNGAQPTINTDARNLTTFNKTVEEVASSIARHIEDWQNGHNGPIPVVFAYEIARDFIQLALGTSRIAPTPTQDGGLVEALREIAEFNSGEDQTLGALARLARVRTMARAALSKAGVA